MDWADPDAAKELLHIREGKPHRRHIGNRRSGQPDPVSLPGLSQWATSSDIDAVVWIGLPPKFQGEERIPSAEQVVEYLQALPDEDKAAAIECIQRAPTQIDTAYRREIARVMPETVAG